MNQMALVVAGLLVITIIGTGTAATDIQSIGLSTATSSFAQAYAYNDDNITGTYYLYGALSFSADGSSGFGRYMLGKVCIEPTSCSADGNCVCTPSECYATCCCSSPVPTSYTHSQSGSITGACGENTYAAMSLSVGTGVSNPSASTSAYVIFTSDDLYTVSGTTGCLDYVSLYWYNSTNQWDYMDTDSLDDDTYLFKVAQYINYRLVFSNGAYYDFYCSTSDTIFDYDGCIWVYGYTCGIDTIKLRDAASQVIGTEYQDSGYDTYEMQGISAGNDYTISFYDMGLILCYEHAFTCTGDHVLVDYDRCNWLYPPSPWDTPYTIYLWAGYDYNIVVFKDEHGNFIENSQLAVYDKTDGQYLQRWTDASDGYTLLGAKFATDHDVILSLRTFDGVFTLDTTYPANGSAAAGEEDITTTNWTVPIKYNLNVLPVDQYGAALFDVFCGLSEYTPLNPGAFWGMDLSDQGYVPVTNCSGFAMCDIIAEKEGYIDYNVEALNWTSKSALVKDYRHNVVMEEE